MIPKNFGNYFASQVYHICQSPRPKILLTYATWVPRLFPSDYAYVIYWRNRQQCIKKILNSTTPNTGKEIKPNSETPNHGHNCNIIDSDLPFWEQVQ